MADRIGGTRPLTPPEQEPEVPPPTDDDRSSTTTLTKTQKKKKKKAIKMARQNSTSTPFGADPNGDTFHHHGMHPDPVLHSPTEPVLESPQEERNSEVFEDEVMEIDPEGDLLLLLSSPQGSGPEHVAKATRNQAGLDSHKQSRIRVSSHHLRLSSPVLRRMLVVVGDHSPRIMTTMARLNLTEPEEPMVKLLNLVHNRDLKILRSSTLEDLCEIARLVSRYEMAESTGFVARTWIEKLKSERKLKKGGDELPTEFGEELLRWLFVSWAFCLPKEFETLSRIAILQSPKRIDSEEFYGARPLDFPNGVVDAIDSRRQDAVQSLLSAYERSMNSYLGDDGRENLADDAAKTICPHGSETCDSTVFGLLFRSGRRAHLQPTSPTPSCDGLSFEGAKKGLEEIQFPACPEEDRMVTAPAPVAPGTRKNGVTAAAPCAQPNGIAPQSKCTPGSDFRQAIKNVAQANQIEGLDIRTLLAPEHRALYGMPGNNIL